MGSWDWFFERACEAWDATGDFDAALAMMVDRLAAGIPKEVLAQECGAYISAASHEALMHESRSPHGPC
jgi:hypothetical protein